MWLRRQPKEDTGPALVLGGGGALGALQVGLLKVLLRSGFRPGLIVGTSVGALNGAFLAFHPNEEGVARLEESWNDVKFAKLFHRNLVRMAFCVASKRFCVYTNDYLREIVTAHAQEDDFAAAKVPLFVTTTDISTGTKVVFSTGRVSEAVLASTAVPGLFSPARIDRRLFVDGGVTANLDIATAIEAGANDVLAIDLNLPLSRSFPAHILGVLTRSVDVLMREQVERDVRYYAERATITVLRPGHAVPTGLQAARHTRELIALGESIGQDIMPCCFDSQGRLVPGIVEGRTGVGSAQEIVGATE
jgi:NTE family protein